MSIDVVYIAGRHENICLFVTGVELLPSKLSRF